MTQIQTFQLDIDNELLLNADPVSLLGAATKQYVDANAGIISSSISAASGFIQFSNGFIFQWGLEINVNPAGKLVALPITFPTANRAGQAGTNTVTGGLGPPIATVLTSTSQITIDPQGLAGLNISWFVIGN